MTSVHPIYLLTTIIKYGTKTATGFFFSDKDQLYLVTNKHVLYGTTYAQDGSVAKIEHITLTLHTNSEDFTANEDVTISLFDNDGKKLWLEHSDPTIDVVLIPINIDEKKFLISKMNRSFIDNTNNLSTQFEKILVVGYPFGWYDEKFNMPIVRVGHLSSPFKVSFKGQPIMIGDAITHAGMSGSPVMMLLKDPVTTDEKGQRHKDFGTKYILAGIYSGQFKIAGKLRPHLITVWFPEVIEEILD